jgi:hypothetical protein
MRVRLTRKLADEVDGTDVKGRVVGDVLELPLVEAHLLIAENRAVPEPRSAERPDFAYSEARAS